MSHHELLQLASVLVLGISAQWLAWRLKLPSILLLLLFGFLAGPVFHLLHPDRLLGPVLFPIVSLSVAVILFEGGLTLSIRDLAKIGKGLVSLVTVGVLVAWILTTVAAKFVLGYSTPLAVLVGAILVVTGPTVILPLLRHVRPRGKVGTLVKWEGILNDPIGVLLAILVFEVIVAGGWREGSQIAVTGFLETIFLGGLIGLLGAALLVLVIRFYHVPDYLENPVSLMTVLLVYALADLVQAESGLFSVTVMGVAMANQRMVEVRHIIEFKENLRVVLISSLFILLAARIEISDLTGLGWSSVVFLVLLIVVVRPATVLLSTFGSGLTWKDKTFLAWMAPRGIVAAATSSLFAIRLDELGYAGANTVAPVVFLVIVGTVAFYGLTAGPVARRLGISGGPPQGVLIVGAHRWARQVAESVQAAGVEVLLVDNNRAHVRAARLAGLTAVQRNVLAETLPDELNLEGIGRLLALTPNDEVNSLAALHFGELWGAREVYQLPPEPEEERDKEVPPSLRGRFLFGKEQSFDGISRRFRRGAVVKATGLTDEFRFESFREHYGESAVVLFVVDGKRLLISTVQEPVKPKAGQTVVALVDPVGEEGKVGTVHR